MKLVTTLVALSACAFFALSQNVVTWDPSYNNPDFCLGNTACSNSANGLQAKCLTLETTPNF